MDEELEVIRQEIGALIERLDDLVYDAIRQQLHGDDQQAAEKRLARARNALRRAHAILTPVSEFGEE